MANHLQGGLWGPSVGSYPCVAASDNQCTQDQKGGFDFGTLAVGSFNAYAGFNFEGFSCQNQFSKRDGLAKRTFDVRKSYVHESSSR